MLPQPSGDVSRGLAIFGRFNLFSARSSLAGIPIGVTVGTDTETMGGAADAMLGVVCCRRELADAAFHGGLIGSVVRQGTGSFNRSRGTTDLAIV